ncbi:MAG: hypothetical protein KatS3mg087_1459 [Patescibacteria group bacterium]|nr:MAG: hypothetical protein KatS3mg087_1459 [Patescibacteria group bacterium]
MIIQDADLEYDPQEYALLLEPFRKGQADVVYGSRFKGGRPHRMIYYQNQLANYLLTFFSNIFTGYNLSDVETGYKLFRGDLIREMAKSLVSKRFGFEIEVTAKLAQTKARVYEVGIGYYGRSKEEGKHISWRDGLLAIWEILRFNLPAKRNLFWFLSGMTLLVAIGMRFFLFDAHWGLANDDARDVLIAREALTRGELPVIGSFSSAGPFVFGPLFYWSIMFSLIILPSMSGPWVFIGIMSVVTVIVLMRIGYLLGGIVLALILGLLAATSPQMVQRALALGQHSYVGLTSALAILFLILLWQRQKNRYALGLGLCLGVGLSMHYQTINLLILTPLVLLVPGLRMFERMKAFAWAIVGLVIPSLPIMIWDAQQAWANTRNILDYLLIGQNRIYVPNSWRIFLFDFMPEYWSFVVGGSSYVGLMLMGLAACVSGWLVLRRKLRMELLVLGVVFGLLLLVNRFYKGERSEGYLLYLQPLVLIFSGYAIYRMWTIQKLKILGKSLALTMVVLVVAGNVGIYSAYLQYRSPVAQFEETVWELKQQYPFTKFVVYDYGWQNSYQSQPLSFLLEREGLIAKNGVPIGFGCRKECGEGQELVQVATMTGVPVYDLSAVENLNDPQVWMNVNQANLYDDLMRWGKSAELESNFNF